MTKIIPIFPLKIVIFPASKYIIHIYEERYKRMFDYVLKNDIGFGIVPVDKNRMHSVGTQVSVSQIVKQYKTGEFDIIIEGQKRFRILRSWEHEDGYYEADVAGYADIAYSVDPNLIEEFLEKFQSLLDDVEFTINEAFWDNVLSTERKSFKIAEKSGLTLPQQQTLLSLQNEEDRIHYLLDHFDQIGEYIQQKAKLRRIIQNDGYLN